MTKPFVLAKMMAMRGEAKREVVASLMCVDYSTCVLVPGSIESVTINITTVPSYAYFNKLGSSSYLPGSCGNFAQLDI